jgi:hypothetical protein
MLFFSLKLLYPQHFHLARGNHETDNMNMIYGFNGELAKKVKQDSVKNSFSTAFNWLPLGHVIEGKILVVHGGLFSRDGVTLQVIFCYFSLIYMISLARNYEKSSVVANPLNQVSCAKCFGATLRR